MKLIRKLGVRKAKIGKSYQSWGFFKCPDSYCGKEVERPLKDGLKAKSCGCVQYKENRTNYKHGGKGTRLYRIWHNMKQRILNPNFTQYKDYGGRGITICDEWLKFIPFRDWSLSNGYADNLTIDRKENNGNYEPSNCHWIPFEEQSKNKTNTITMGVVNEVRELDAIGGYTQQQLAEKFSVSQSTICKIINNKKWK